MTTTIWLRIASVLAVFNVVFHTMGLLLPPRDPEVRAAVLSMQAHHFNAMGSARTFWDFYSGFSLIITVSLLLVAALCWQLAALVKVDAGRMRPLIGSLSLAACGFAVLSAVYLFAAPTVAIAAIAACIVAAWIVCRPGDAKLR